MEQALRGHPGGAVPEGHPLPALGTASDLGPRKQGGSGEAARRRRPEGRRGR